MSSLAIILLLTALQFVAGLGLLTLFRIQLKPAMFLSLCILLGIAVFSLVPFILQLLYIPLTGGNIFLSLAVACILLNLNAGRRLSHLRSVFRGSRFTITLYEVPFLLVIAFIVFVSVWRCYYYPPTPRDFTSGAEVIAEYAIREKTMVNSVFTLHLETLNNHFKSPFLASLQIIYKYAGFPFGQVWLCNVFICFLVFLYHALSMRIHRMLAGMLLLAFLAIPEMYPYTFMALFDYSNAVFFFLATYFLLDFYSTGRRNQLAFAGLLMGIATYIRSETLVLAALLSLVLALRYLKERGGLWKLIGSGLVLLLPAIIFYILTTYVYIRWYLPIPYDIGGLVNENLLNLRPLWERFRDVNAELIFSKQGFRYYGYLFMLFLLVLCWELAYAKGVNSKAGGWLWAVVVIYLGLPLLGYLLPLLDLDNSTKRGLFKIFPLMLLFIASTSLMTELSVKIRKWELGG
ncbi:MAG TPA: hypothetical protein VD996_04610 [Chitinophagaceae bacterium]|nr:hypothetical protein [Chitinophagaceae bacterium]